MSRAELPSGIDVSNHQGDVNWRSVAGAGHVFAFAKATESTYFRDLWFPRNWSEMKDAGLHRGAYAFARPSRSTPDAEAQYFLEEVERAGGLETGDMLVLDLEDERAVNGGAYGTVGNWALGWCEYVEAAVGYPPLIYTGPWYINQHRLWETPELGRFGLWLAAYQAQIPPSPAPWDVVAFWQWTSAGRVPGVNGDCDVNAFHGAPDRIALYGKPAPPEPAPSPYSVGSGILAAMHEHGDEPASSEVYGEFWSEAMGTSGRSYRWLKATGRVHVYDPAA